MKHSILRWLPFLAVIAVSAMVGNLLSAQSVADMGSQTAAVSMVPEFVSSSTAALENTPEKKAPEKVLVGAYVQNINEVDIKSSQYMLDFYLWFKWRGAIDPTKTFEFQNLLESWALTKEAIYEEPETLADGTRYQVFHVQGKFNEKFNLSRFPLDDQDLVVAIEESRATITRLQYIADETSSGISSKITVPGWQILGSYVKAGEAEYETNFGRVEMSGKERYARLELRVALKRPRFANLIRLFLPVAIVLLSCFIIFFVAPTYGDARVDTPVAGLLTMVALNLTTSGEMPPSGYIRLIDKVYYLAYMAILATLALSIAGVRRSDAADVEGARRIDRLALWIVPTVTAFLMMLLLLFR